MNNIEKLDYILSRNNVCETFYDFYNNDKEFANWLDVNIPEVKDCMNMNQDNPWHIYNVLDHILHSVEEMNKQTRKLKINEKDSRMLSYVMFFHDIGKPKCHIRRYSKLYGREVDSFFNHNHMSCEIANKYLVNLGFEDKEVKSILKLVYKHDIFMFIKNKDFNNRNWRRLTPELVKEEIKDFDNLGEEYKLMRYLVMVGRSDNRAQNPDMTKESLELLDEFDKLLDVIEKERVLKK